MVYRLILWFDVYVDLSMSMCDGWMYMEATHNKIFGAVSSCVFVKLSLNMQPHTDPPPPTILHLNHTI
jgi:hypothetical protein